jgi:hypothetical protein
MEAEEGIEPSNDGFANHCLTTWLLRHLHGTGRLVTGCEGGCQYLDLDSVSGRIAEFRAIRLGRRVFDAIHS